MEVLLTFLATTPPDWLKEWLTLTPQVLAIAAIIISAMRKWLVNPILKNMHDHTNQHSLMEKELAVNGSEYLLPEDERNLPLRTLMIKNRVSFLQHIHETAPLREQYERDLAERLAL